MAKGNGQNNCTQTGPTALQKDRWSLHVPPFPHLKRWCLVCIPPTPSGVETNIRKRFKPPCAISPAGQASCTPNMKVSTQILRPINFVHLAYQTGGILHSPPPLHKVVLVEYSCYDHFPNNYWEELWTKFKPMGKGGRHFCLEKKRF